MGTISAPRTARDLSLRLLELINTQQFDNLGEVFTDDVITEWPQSRERVRGLKNGIAIFSSYPASDTKPLAKQLDFVDGDEGRYLLTPLFTMVKSEGDASTATSTVKTRYPDGSDWYVITIVKTRDGKISHVRQFFAPMYPAPEWRAQWVETMEDDDK